jgi:orotate phosphoribosyltransferase
VQAPREASAIVVGVAVIVERSTKAKVESEGFKYLTAYQLSDLGL